MGLTASFLGMIFLVGWDHLRPRRERSGLLVLIVQSYMLLLLWARNPSIFIQWQVKVWARLVMKIMTVRGMNWLALEALSWISLTGTLFLSIYMILAPLNFHLCVYRFINCLFDQVNHSNMNISFCFLVSILFYLFI